jgi:hypothetical protein
MLGFMPGIHAFDCREQGVDGQDKPGHDMESVVPQPSVAKNSLITGIAP